MKYFSFFLQQLGVIFFATLCHETYHISHGSISEIGIRFGKDGGFFVQGTNRDNEVIAYIITLLVIIICEFIIIKSNNEKNHRGKI